MSEVTWGQDRHKGEKVSSELQQAAVLPERMPCSRGDARLEESQGNGLF